MSSELFTSSIFISYAKGGSYGNKILYENLKFFDKIFVVEDFVTLLMGKKSC